MKELARKLPDKSERSIRAAAELARDGDIDFALARAYYAMFYDLQKEGSFRKHGGVHAAFAEHFVKTGLLDAKFHCWLLDAFDQRIQADYGVEANLTAPRRRSDHRTSSAVP